MGDSFTIKLSNSLVDALVSGAEKSKKKTKKTKSKIPREPPHPQPKAHEKHHSDNVGTHNDTANPIGWPLQPPFFMPAAPPVHPAIAELDAIRASLQESERVVEKLQKQEESMIQEVTQRAKDLRDKEFKIPSQKPFPCPAEKDACVSCYSENLKNPLKCSEAVKAFADCARRGMREAQSADK